MCFWTVYGYNFLTKWNTLVCWYMPHWRIMMIFRDKWNRYTVQQTSSRVTFDQCSPAVKTLISRLLHANVCLPIVEQIHTGSMKRFRAAYSNAYRIMYHISRNVRVLSHQLSHRVTIFDALLQNNMHRFFRCASSSNSFIRYLQMSDAFHKSWYFLDYWTRPYDGEQLMYLLMCCTSVRVSLILFLHNNKPSVCFVTL